MITERLSMTHKKMILRENKFYDPRYDACPKYVTRSDFENHFSMITLEPP